MFLNALIKSVNMPCDLLGLVYTSNCECDVVLSYLKYCQWQWYFVWTGNCRTAYDTNL